jgi:hypothetical protein
MARLTVTLSVEQDDEGAFWAAFDEDRVVESLPSSYAHLVWAGDPPAVEFYAEAESAERFIADFDEELVSRSLPPGSRARLAGVVEDGPRIVDRVRNALHRKRT